MSTLSEQDHLDPNNPMYYAPRWLRERPESRLPASNDTKPELAKRSASSPPSFDTLLEEAVNKALRNPLDPEASHESPGYDNGLGRRTALITVAGRFAAAVGVSALVALFFVIMIPASRDHTPDSSASGVLQSLKAAFYKPAPREDEPKPALAEFQPVLTANRTAQPAPPTQPAQATQPAMTHEQSEALLHQFVQWQQQKPNAADAPPQ